MSAAFLGNTTAIQEMFIRVGGKFAALWKREVFLHHYFVCPGAPNWLTNHSKLDIQ